MSNEDKINEMNNHLENVGSKFRTDDGLHFIGFLSADDHAFKFLRRTFPSIEEAHEFIMKIED